VLLPLLVTAIPGYTLPSKRGAKVGENFLLTNLLTEFYCIRMLPGVKTKPNLFSPRCVREFTISTPHKDPHSRTRFIGVKIRQYLYNKV
jgi:hypothetical protein